MLYLRSWLEEYINLSEYTNAQLKELLTMKSGEVEEIFTKSDYFDNKVLIGKIENVRKHDTSDRLKIFDVNLGKHQNKIQIVSAAPNVVEGLIVPVAVVGAKLPFGTILERQLRGEKSQGMCCGMSELMLETEYSKGLWELVGVGQNLSDLENLVNFPIKSLVSDLGELESQILGKSICEILPEYFPVETVIDIKYLADKLSSCGNHLGLALDLAICLEDLNLLTTKAKNLLNPEYLVEKMLNSVAQKSIPVDIDFEDKTGYTNTFGLYNLKLEKEYILPHLFQKRMFLTDRNSIGGLADLSNYLLADIGQPNHFFSSGKIYELAKGQSIDWSIMPATEDQEFIGLGQLKNTIIPKGVEILYQDKQTILTLPGISGGETTKVEPEETEIFIEIANFPASRIAKSSFDLGYRSDGAKIWASGVNISLQFVFLARLLELLDEQEISYNIENIFFWLSDAIKENYDLQKTSNLLQKATRILEIESGKSISIDFEYLTTRMDNQSLSYWQPIFESKLNLLGRYANGVLKPNQFYSQINTSEAVFEQIARLVGFENLASDHLKISTDQRRNPGYHILIELKKIIVSFGFQEIITRPFIPFAEVQNPKTAIKLQNPYDSQKNALRDTLLPGLLRTASENLLNGFKQPAIFEVSKLYSHTDSLTQNFVIQGVLAHEDPYFLTSLIRAISKQTGLKYNYKNLESDYADYGQGYTYTLENGQNIHLVEIRNSLKKSYNLPLNKRFWFFNIENIDDLTSVSPYRKYFNESAFPSISRTYSFLVEKGFSWQELENYIININLSDVVIRTTPKERFEENGKDVLNFEVDFVSYERTLTGEEISIWEKELMEKISTKATKR